MKNLVMWIPEFGKGMLEVMKETQEAAGSGKKGIIVFWIIFFWFIAFLTFFIMWFSKYAYNNFTEFLSYFNITVAHVDIEIPSSFFTNLWLAIGLSILYMIALVGIAAIIGAFLGMLFSYIFRHYTIFRIDKVIDGLRPMLEHAGSINETDEFRRLLDDFRELDRRWANSRFNRISRHLTTKRNREKWSKEGRG